MYSLSPLAPNPAAVPGSEVHGGPRSGGECSEADAARMQLTLETCQLASRCGHVSGCTTVWGFTFAVGVALGVKLPAEKREPEEL